MTSSPAGVSDESEDEEVGYERHLTHIASGLTNHQADLFFGDGDGQETFDIPNGPFGSEEVI